MDRKEALQLIESARWYHRFELLPGIFTPGITPLDPKVFFAHLGLPARLDGKKVLDVGTLDGPIAFECEARGASVTAIDIQDPSLTGFNTAKKILGSHVKYFQGSVYDASSLLKDRYDYIFFLGVFYHLKCPVLAFEELSKILVDGGYLAFEGECWRNYAEDETGKWIKNADLRQIALSDIPICLFYAGTFRGDDTNWFIPNAACLKGWLETAGLKLIVQKFHEVDTPEPPAQRMGGIAQKVAGLRVEHRLAT